MSLVLALVQALSRVRSPASRARHAPPSRAMEHDRAIEVYGDCRGRRARGPWGGGCEGPGGALGLFPICPWETEVGEPRRVLRGSER